MSVSPRTRVGPYEVVAAIGAGGMGEVYRARDIKLQRDVALKLLPDLFVSDPERLARFKREAQTLASLNHPHIAQIHGLEDSAGDDGVVRPALVMEYVAGEDLADRLARGPLPLDEALPIARQLAEALEAAHEHGIVHRDLKPANIKVRDDGTVKVLDFGLAKAMDPAAASSLHASHLINSPTITSPLTMGGVILGTAAYMSPEQAKGRTVDRRADIWAFGCVLYEMLTAKKAFDGEDVTEMLGAVVKTDPDWAALPAHTPPPITTLLKRCLKKDRTQRLQHIGDARLEIHETLVAPASAAPTVASATRRASLLPWAVAGMFGVAAAALAAYALRPAPSPPMMRLEIPTLLSSRPSDFAISPDGRWVVFVGSANGRDHLWIRPIDGTTARLLPGTETPLYPFWSPDSRSIGFFTSGQLRRIEVTGGASQRIASVTGARGGTWNADGTIVFGSNTSGALHRLSAKGGEPQPVTKTDAAVAHTFPSFLPDGQHFLYVEEAADFTRHIKIGALDGSLDVVVARVSGGESTRPGFHRAGFVLFTQRDGIFRQRINMRTLAPEGERELALSNDSGDVVGPLVSVARDGAFVYRVGSAFASSLAQLAWRDRSGRELPPAFDYGGMEPEISRDGRFVLVVRSETGDNNDVWMIDLARGVRDRKTSDAGTELWPTWSPNGQEFAFGKGTVFVQSLTGARRQLEATRAPFQIFPSDWSPDGRYLLCRANHPESQSDVWAYPVDGVEKPFPIANSKFEETRAQFSPDGRWVSYESDEAGRMDIYIRPFNRPGHTIKVSSTGGSEARWHRNGRELFFIGPGGKLMVVNLRPDAVGDQIDADTPRELFTTNILRGGLQTSNYKFQYAVAADGQRFLINEQASQAIDSSLIVTLNWKP